MDCFLSFQSLCHHANKYKLDVRHYILPNLREKPAAKKSIAEPSRDEADVEETRSFRIDSVPLYAFPSECVDDAPRLCTYNFMDGNELDEILALRGDLVAIKQAIKRKIYTKLFPSGTTRIVLIDLIYSITKFCLRSGFARDQIGAILGIFYAVHRRFCGNLNVTPQESYDQFIELLLLHTIDLPPNSIKYFTLEESRKVALYFCTLYLRFLPLIRLLCLPNVALSVNYTLEPETTGKSKSKKDGKKDAKKQKSKRK